MSRDIVERLRDIVQPKGSIGFQGPLRREAADEITRLRAERDAAVAALEKSFRVIAHEAEQHSYGFYRPEDPRDFTPDFESSSEKEVEAWRAARDAWDAAGGKPDKWDEQPQSGWNESGTMHILRAPWGIGVAIVRDPELCALRDEIRQVLARIRGES